MKGWRRARAGLSPRSLGLGVTALLALTACGIEANDLTLEGNGQQEIEFGTIPGTWVEVGDEISVAALNPESEEITASDLLVVDGTILATVVSAHDEGSGYENINPGVFVFDRGVDDADWSGSAEAVVEADLDAGEAFGNIALHTLGGNIGVTYTLFANGDNELRMATVGDAGEPQAFPELDQMGLVVSSSLDDSLVYTASTDDNNDLWLVRSATAQGDTQHTVEAGPETFAGTYFSNRHESRTVRNWDFSLTSQRVFLVSTHDDEDGMLRLSWRPLNCLQDVTDSEPCTLDASDWSLRSAEFNYDTRGYTVAFDPLPYNVRLTSDPSASPAQGGGVFIAIIHRERGDEGNRVGQLFRYNRSDGMTTVGPRFFGPTGTLGNIRPEAAGNLLDVFVTRQGKPVVVWNEPEVKAAVFVDGQWNLLGGPESGLTVDEGDLAAAAFDDDTDTLYVMVNRQVYRFED